LFEPDEINAKPAMHVNDEKMSADVVDEELRVQVLMAAGVKIVLVPSADLTPLVVHARH